MDNFSTSSCLSAASLKCLIAPSFLRSLLQSSLVLLVVVFVASPQQLTAQSYAISLTGTGTPGETWVEYADLNSTLQPDTDYTLVFVDEAVQGLELSAEAGDQHTFQLISHGRPGRLYLDGAWRDAPEIAEWLQQEQLLAGQTQLNIYGCEFAKGPEGKAAVTFLEATLGISVAASDDLTGIDGDWELEVGLAVGELKLPDYRFNLQCAVPADAPTASVFAIQPSCAADGSTINTDGYLQISEVTGGLSYEIAIDGGAFGPRADIGATFPAIILSSESNPAGSRDYIVRIYEEDMNGASACFTDVPVTMQQQTCTVGCDCEEVIYLNEPAIGAVLKFEVGPDLLLTEVTGANGGTPPNEHWYPGTGTSDLRAPHGLAFDLNGNIYIGSDFQANTPIRKFDCDGNISPEDGTTIDQEYILTNMFSIGNTLYTTRNDGPASYDLCTGDAIGTMCLNDAAGVPLSSNNQGTATTNWGLNYNSNLDLVYVTGSQQAKQGFWVFTSAELEAAIGGAPPCIDQLVSRDATVAYADLQVGDNFLPNNISQLNGITSDNSGNIYVAGWLSVAGAPGFVLKYDPTGGFLAATAANPGMALTRGVVWSETTNRIYVSNQTDAAAVDCISAFDPADLSYLGAAAPNPNIAQNNSGKAMAIVKECCPTNNNQVVNVDQCVTTTSDPIFLNELFPCDGVLCNGEWTPADAASAAIFDDCNQTIITGVDPGCYSFTRSSDGTGSGAKCGAFIQTLNVGIGQIEAALIVDGEQVICRDEEPAPIVATAAVGAGGALSYQWYSSIESETSGYSLILGATELTYTPTAASLVSDTTYFRIVSNITTCTSAICSDTSEAVFVVVLVDPLMITAAASCDDENGMQVAANTYYIEVSAITGGDDAGSYEVTVTGATTPTQTFDGTGSLFFGPFTHSGTGGAVQVVSVQDNRVVSDCPTQVEVPEILCGINDGGQDPGCFCAGPTTDPAIPTSFILAQSQPGTFMAGGSSGQIQKYVLVDASGTIVAMNLTGLFEVPTAGTYTPYAINYRADEDPTLMNFLIPGQPILPILEGVMGNGVLADACFAACNIDATVTYESCSCYSVGSTLFSDLDNDGLFEEGDGENGLPGIVVEVYAVGADPLVDDPIGTTTTDSNGDYYFGGLDPGMYFLNIPTPPSVYPISSTPTDLMDNGEDNDDNGMQTTSGMPVTSPVFELGGLDAEPSGAAESGTGGTQDDAADLFGDMTQDFGFIAPVTVGDTTFVDIDMDGTQSIGDLPLTNVTVTIFDVATGAEVAFDADGNVYTATQLTDPITGAYLFENLPPGNYYVEFDISSSPNGAYYDFTTPNAGSDDTADSDAVPAAATDDVANSSATGPLTSGQSDLTLDAGVVCAVSMTVADPFTICATDTIDLTADATVLPVVLGGNWSTADGSGDFLNADGDPIGAPYAFGTAVGYVPSTADRNRGYVTLTLTSNMPPAASGCGPVSEEVRIEILNVDCGSFFWDGTND